MNHLGWQSITTVYTNHISETTCWLVIYNCVELRTASNVMFLLLNNTVLIETKDTFNDLSYWADCWQWWNESPWLARHANTWHRREKKGKHYRPSSRMDHATAENKHNYLRVQLNCGRLACYVGQAPVVFCLAILLLPSFVTQSTG